MYVAQGENIGDGGVETDPHDDGMDGSILSAGEPELDPTAEPSGLIDRYRNAEGSTQRRQAIDVNVDAIGATRRTPESPAPAAVQTPVARSPCSASS